MQIKTTITAPVLVITLSTQREADILDTILDSPALWPLDWSLALNGAPKRSLLSENTYASITALGTHGGHHFPAVDDRVIALDAAQQAVPIITEWGKSERGK